MDADILIVDGHSVIFGWPDLRALHSGANRARARDQLVSLLTEFQDTSGIKTVVVFDGRGTAANEVAELNSIQIFYSAEHGTADQIIERLVAKYAEHHRIMVATSDRMEQQTVISFGGSTMDVETLRDVLTRNRADFDRHMDKIRKAPGKKSRR